MLCPKCNTEMTEIIINQIWICSGCNKQIIKEDSKNGCINIWRWRHKNRWKT